MLDIKFIRENVDKVKQAMKDRNMELDDIIDELIELDITRRGMITSLDSMKYEQNTVTKKVAALKKEKGEIPEDFRLMISLRKSKKNK